MGYFSDVKLIVSEKGFNELNSFIESLVKTQGISEEEGNYLKLADRINADLLHGTVEIVWSDFKWYSDYKGVENVEEGLHHLEMNGFGYEYGIIGEESSDIEIDHISGEHDSELPTLCVRRTFDTFW